MLFKRTSRSDPERVFMVIKNGDSAILTNGQVVGWDMGDADGINVAKCSTAFKRMASCAGIVAETIAVGEYGLIQVYGYHGAVRVDSSTTVDIYTGAPLFMSVDAYCLEGPYSGSGALSHLHAQHRPVACALEGYGSVGTTGTIKAIIFAL